MKKRILVYRSRYLPASETFIYEQIIHMQRYEPYILCREVTAESHFLFPYPHLYQLGVMSKQELRRRFAGVRLIYARFGMGGAQMLSVKRKAKLPMLTSFHGTDVSRQVRINGAYRAVLPDLFKYGEKFTVVCEHMKEKLMILGCPPQKIVVLKSGIDIKKFRYSPNIAQEDDSIRILSIGRLTEKKGMHFLISAFHEVAQNYPSARLVIAGEGEERENLEGLVEQLKLNEQVNLIGQISHEQVQEELQSCDIFVNASCQALDGNEEGIPNVLIEAMATGRLVIATEHAGIPELVEHGKTGFLVPEGNVKALGEMLISVIAQRGNWSEIIKAGRKKVEQEHDILKQVNKLEDIMDDLRLG